MSPQPFYAAVMPFIKTKGKQAYFGGKNDGSTWSGLETRSISPAVLVVDKHYWELLGKPDAIVVGFSTPEGFKEFSGKDAPWIDHILMEATDQ